MRTNTHCQTCNRITVAELVKNITGSGVYQVFWRCFICKNNSRGGANYIKHDILKEHGVILEDIPVNNDYRSLENACAVCGELGAEYHHWAPRYLFEDADKWPTSYLCRYHHLMWHGLVTPEMCKNGRSKV